MRVTVHMPDEIGEDLRATARSRQMSVSALTATAVASYLQRMRKQEIGGRLLDLIDRNVVSADALSLLDEGRRDDRP